MKELTVKRPDEALMALFEPRSVAIIGASQNPDKIGYKIVQNIVTGGYTGKLYPVNPKGGDVLGHHTYTSLADIPGDVDMACLSIPVPGVISALKECVAKKVKSAVIITSGFAEVGNTEGEAALVRFCAENPIRIVGPNCFGVYSACMKMNCTFGPPDVLPGHVAIISQSGALGIAMIGKTRCENLGLSSIVSVGNKADISELELLTYLAHDPQTRVILMYVEGVKQGEKLVQLLHLVTRLKPVVVIKSGRSKRGAAAAASHTGSLAGADVVFDDIARQCGLIRAESLEEGLNWCKFLANSTLPKGEEAVIITNGGGIGVLATDACEKYNVQLCSDQQMLKDNFGPVTPDLGSVKNPIDMTGTATPADYDRALGAALLNEKVHSVIVLGCETAVFNDKSFAEVVRRRTADFAGKKPVVFSVVGGEALETAISTLRKEQVPIFGDAYSAVSCMGALYQYYRHRLTGPPKPTEAEGDFAAINTIIDQVRADGRRFLLAKEAHAVMAAMKLRTPKARVVKTMEDAVKAAEWIGYPVVLKIVSRDIIHKSDAGGLALNLENQKEVIEAYEAIHVSCLRYKPNAKLEGIEVCEMVKPSVETIVGARRDASFGPTVMFGLGGIYVELMKDVTFRAYPLAVSEARGMVAGIRSYPLLLGMRGAARKDIEGAEKAIQQVGAILAHCPAISDIEINPLIVYDQGDGVMAVDVRILLTAPEEKH